MVPPSHVGRCVSTQWTVHEPHCGAAGGAQPGFFCYWCIWRRVSWGWLNCSCMFQHGALFLSSVPGECHQPPAPKQQRPMDPVVCCCCRSVRLCPGWPPQCPLSSNSSSSSTCHRRSTGATRQCSSAGAGSTCAQPRQTMQTRTRCRCTRLHATGRQHQIQIPRCSHCNALSASSGCPPLGFEVGGVYRKWLLT